MVTPTPAELPQRLLHPPADKGGEIGGTEGAAEEPGNDQTCAGAFPGTALKTGLPGHLRTDNQADSWAKTQHTHSIRVATPPPNGEEPPPPRQDEGDQLCRKYRWNYCTLRKVKLMSGNVKYHLRDIFLPEQIQDNTLFYEGETTIYLGGILYPGRGCC